MTQNDSGTIISNNLFWKKRLKIILSAAFIIAVCVVIRFVAGGPEKADATPPQQAQPRQSAVRTSYTSPVESPTAKPVVSKPLANKSAASASKAPKSIDPAKTPPPEIVADVNGRKITREELAQECLTHYGKEILDRLINKQLISNECRRQNIEVSREEVDAEIERMATRFGIPVDQWLKLLKSERGIDPEQYGSDIIWPTLALRKLAGEKLRVSKEELTKEYDIQYGPAIKARLISCKDEQKAKNLRAKAIANPDEFGTLARDNSEDIASASAKGLIQPIRLHGSYEGIEKAAFSMADGDISQVIPAGGQFVIIKREGLIPASNEKIEKVAPKLEEIIRERKLRKVANDVFQQLKDNAKVEQIWGDPAKQQKMPGVAATIDGNQILVRELALECIDRYGKEVLEGTINRTLIEVECKKRNITVTEKDMQDEITRAAALGVKPKADGTPDVKAWLEQITKEEGATLDIYRRDVVWPSAAMRKLAGDKVNVSEEDMKRGFDANYGPKVRCLAIVLNNQRRAQEVFEKARKNNTSEFFGELAEQYSIEPSSRALRGEVPPIRKWGGQPNLEKEAFALKPGELSGIIQVGDKFILLRCEGYTQAAKINLADVRDEIYKDLYDKKLRLKMTEYFENMQDNATIRNYLVGTNHEPKEMSKAPDDIRFPTIKQVPAKKG